MNKLIITKNLPLLPEGWEWVKMEELCEKITDGTHFTPTYLVEHRNPGPQGQVTEKRLCHKIAAVELFKTIICTSDS